MTLQLRPFSISVLGLAVAGVAVTACGSSPEAADRTSDLRAFVSLFSGYSADYNPVGSPQVLAEASSLVVLGHIGSVSEGRSYNRPGSEATPNKTVLIHLVVTEVLSGDDGYVSDGTVYAEIPSPGGVSADVYNQAAPKDADVLMYLVPKPEPGERDRQVVATGAGWPADVTVMTFTNPQGFVIDSGKGEVAQVIGGEWVESSDLRDFLPNSEAFPYDAEAPHDET